MKLIVIALNARARKNAKNIVNSKAFMKSSTNERKQKMKFHKIRGIEKSICTAEQKIAYNYAFSDYVWVTKSNMELRQYLDNVASRIKADEKIMNKYDIDAIIHCLRNGFVNYCKAKYHILPSYEEIGKMFPSLYPIK